MDGNTWAETPFLGRRDLFYMEERNGGPEQLTFVRHDFWLPKMSVFGERLWTNVSAWGYKSAFKSQA